VAQRVPALLEELDRCPDDRAEIVRAAWAWNLMTSRWPVWSSRAGTSWSCTLLEFGRRRCDLCRVWLVGLPVTGWWVRSWRVGCGARPIR
jgi:hypothetical protein